MRGSPMVDYEFSEHAYDMLKERNVREAWVKLTMEAPEKQERHGGMVHYVRAIGEYEGRYLRVVVNPDVKPQRIVTRFFDRRLRRKS